MKKLWKQDRGQANKLENGNKVKMMLKVFAIPILTAI